MPLLIYNMVTIKRAGSVNLGGREQRSRRDFPIISHTKCLIQARQQGVAPSAHHCGCQWQWNLAAHQHFLCFAARTLISSQNEIVLILQCCTYLGFVQWPEQINYWHNDAHPVKPRLSHGHNTATTASPVTNMSHFTKSLRTCPDFSMDSPHMSTVVFSCF